MPIVKGRYEARISTTFRSVEEGLTELKKRIGKSRKIRISNIPMELLYHFKPDLEGKDVMIILPLGSKPNKEIREIGAVAVTKARIYKDYKGVEVNVGSIFFPDRIFGILWTKDNIIEVDAMDYGKCVKCMQGTFEMGWRYSDKSQK